jgi:hypothetical protein
VGATITAPIAAIQPARVLLLTDYAKLSIKIRRCEEDLAITGPLAENASGTPIKHPLISVISTYRTEMMAIARSCGISANVAKVSEGRQPKQHEALLKATAITRGVSLDDEDSLLAR